MEILQFFQFGFFQSSFYFLEMLDQIVQFQILDKVIFFLDMDWSLGFLNNQLSFNLTVRNIFEFFLQFTGYFDFSVVKILDLYELF